MTLRQHLTPEAVAGGGLLALAYLTMLASVVNGLWWVFLIGAIASYAVDYLLLHHFTEFSKSIQQIRLGITPRTLLRQLLVLGLLITSPVATSAGIGLVLLTFLALFGLQLLCGVAARRLRTHRRLPVVTRNIDLGPLNIPDSPPMPLVREPMSRLLPLDSFLIAGVVAFMVFGSSAAVIAGGTVTLTLTVLALVLFGWHYQRARAIPTDALVMDFAQAWLDSYQPEVVLYFSGSADSTYQVNMWLETMDRTPRRTVIVLRERAIAAKLAPTRIPVLCVPTATDLMGLDFGPARVALYPANTGKNIHMLRNPMIKHVFIGHGDSDKIASINPYSKVYDEVWTAGRAGRDRYDAAQVGVRTDEVVEVGRPQLDGARTDTAPNALRTVLYAPTWEGWTDDPGNTSLTPAGPTLVRKLLQAEPAVRVLYKPHPFTGTRSTEARQAHRTIISLIENANRDLSRTGEDYPLSKIDAQLTALSTNGKRWDEAHNSREEGSADPDAAAKLRALSAEWHESYWKGKGDSEHLVIQGPRPSLYSCFHQADLLISDISSVVADFIATEKPYAVTNCEGITNDEFRDRHPTASAAYLFSSDGDGVDEALDAIHLPATDRLADERVRLRSYLLGGPDSQTRFNAAIDDLYRRGSELRPLSAAPAQRETQSSSPERTLTS